MVLVPADEIRAAGPIFTRSVRFHGPRNATVGSPKSTSTSVGMYGSPVPAFLRLLDEAHHRCVALGERRLVGQIG